jgi:mono/diheme cytochrome c family protein
MSLSRIPGSAIALCFTLLASRAAFAQNQTRPAERSTLAGVYTEEQATRGKNSFLGSCKSCHAPESQTGTNFTRLWLGKPLLDLFKYVSEAMPENDPGTLPPEMNADIVAYLLQLNAMPAGKTELVADTSAMRATRVEIKESGSGASSRTSRR